MIHARAINTSILPLFAALALFVTQARAADSDLFLMPSGVHTRWASPENWTGEKGKGAQANAGRKGSPNFPFPAGKQQVLAEVKGQGGTVRRIWIGMRTRTPEMLRGVKIEMFWDGANEPAVSAPVGDFFCQGLGRMAAFENEFFSSPEARTFNSTVPMPFRTGMKIVLANESGKDMPDVFYDVDYTVGDRHPDNMLYFHAHWRRENPTTLAKDFEILPKVKGRGRYLGAVISVIPDTARYGKTWWGEGEVKAYVDGDTTHPTLAGTGTEDYVGSGFYIGKYACRYFGCPIADDAQYRFSFYRLHVPDPVWFYADGRVTIQQIGYPKVERQDDWAACAWFYLDTPTNGLPPLPPAPQRMAGLADKPVPKQDQE